MAAAAILNFDKCQYLLYPHHISTKFGGQMHHGHMQIVEGSLITLSTTVQDGCRHSA